MTLTMDVNADPPRFTRKWFGDIFFGCWGLAALMNVAVEVLGWKRDADPGLRWNRGAWLRRPRREDAARLT
jgi:hypothetical protein